MLSKISLKWSLQWRHNGLDGVSIHQHHDCLLNRLSKKIKVRRHWPLWGEFTGDRWIPRTKDQKTENGSISWRHHDDIDMLLDPYNYSSISYKGLTKPALQL